MMPRTSLSLDGTRYAFDDLRLNDQGHCAYFDVLTRQGRLNDFHKALIAFINDFLSERETTTVYTSGSTGQPKAYEVQKSRMVASAQTTIDALQLRAGQPSLLAMPLRYIGAKMMVVRALVADLDLRVVTPSRNPFQYSAEADHWDTWSTLSGPMGFVAVTPMQTICALACEQTRERVLHTQKLLIGGGAIDDTLRQTLRTQMVGVAYSSYGMTETLSHIALKVLNGPQASDYYYPVAGVTLTLSEQNTLQIDAPHVTDQRLTTNDIVQFNAQGGFKVLGRIDNVINSGGVKLQTEQIEEKLKPLLEGVDYAISSVPDTTYGQAVTLAVATQNGCLHALAALENSQSPLWQNIRQTLSRYEVPKHLFLVEALPRTETQKIDRANLKKMLQKLHEAAAPNGN